MKKQKPIYKVSKKKLEELKEKLKETPPLPPASKFERLMDIERDSLRMVLKGSKGAVQFVLLLGWNIKGREVDHLFPMPADLGYHSPVPMYDGHDPIQEECQYLDGKPCYYDGSGLNAERIFEVLKQKGSEAVWKELEEYYKSIFT